MAIEFRCTKCGKLLRTKDDTAGKQAKCPECGTVLQIPAAGETPLAPPAGAVPPPPQDFAYGTPSPGASANPYAAPQYGGPMAAAPDSSGRTGPPWERDGQSANSFVATVKEVFLDPMTTFSTMRREGGFGKPLIYAIVGTLIGGIIASLYNLALPNPFLMIMEGFGRRDVAAQQAPAAIGLVCSIIAIPIGVAIGSFIWAGIYHLMLMLVGGARAGFETTYRVVCYVAGSVALIQVIPFLGPFIGIIAHIVYTIIGFMNAHEISTGKAILAVLLPMLVCCGAIIAFGAAIFALAFSAAQG
jgi:phage FluMu protein Com